MSKMSRVARISGILMLGTMLVIRFSVLAETVPTSFAQAQQALDKGNYAQAEAQFRALLAQTPNSPEVLQGLGIALQMQAKPAEAMTVFERALKLKRLPGAIAVWRQLIFPVNDNHKSR